MPPGFRGAKPQPKEGWTLAVRKQALALLGGVLVLAWRRSFTRYEAIAALRNAIYACELAGARRLTD